MLKRHGGWLGLLAIGIVLTAVIGWLMVAPAPVSHVVPPSPVDNSVQIKLNTVKITGVSNGKITWSIEAASFDMNRNQRLRITGLHKVVLLNGGKQEFAMKADVLEQDKVSGNLNLTGNVEMSGKDIKLQTPAIKWNDYLQQIHIPGRLVARFGDYTLIAPGGAVINIRSGTLQCTGGIELQAEHSRLNAGGMMLWISQQSFELTDPVVAQMQTGDLQQWAAGQNLPEIPQIPATVKERYQEYRTKQETKYR